MNGASSGVLAALAGVVMVPVVLVLAMSGDKPPSVCGAPTAIGGELPDGGTYTDDMAGNAQAIVETGIALGVPPRGQVIALATALVESDLRNLSYGDRDSVGLFHWFRYHTMRYRFDAEGVSMSWGILFRREVLLNYSRIQDIHLQ